jgi:hypothetical protein
MHVAELDRRRRLVVLVRGGREIGEVPTATDAATSASHAVSVRRSSTSWMRPRAPSACPTEVIAPKNEPSGCTRKNRNITNVTSPAIVIAPEATRKPPTPRTTSSDSCRATPATGTTNADAFATCTPASYAPRAVCSMLSRSRSDAPEARIVRIDPTARSTPEASSPTFSCCTAVARRIRPLSATTTATDAPTTTRMSTSSTGSMMNIATIAPTKMSALPIESASPWVSTAYSRVVSVPTRETRSPVRRASYSCTGAAAAMRRRRLE